MEEEEDEEDDEEGDDEVIGKPTDWTLEFPPLSEHDLMSGHILKPRLLWLLDHPQLKNHLLARKNILPLLVRLPGTPQQAAY